MTPLYLEDSPHAELAFAGHLEKLLLIEAAPSEVHLDEARSTKACSAKLTNKLQGLKNNCRGLTAELRVAKLVPEVVGLSQSFPLGKKGKTFFLSCFCSA